MEVSGYLMCLLVNKVIFLTIPWMNLCQLLISSKSLMSITIHPRWRPLNGPGVTKNVMISVNANGALQHWHTTSGKLLHTIYDELN